MLKSAQLNPSSHKDELLMFVSSPRRCYSPVLCPERTSTHVPSAQWLSHGVDLLTASLPVRFFFLKADNQDPGCYFHFVLIPEQLSHRDKSRLFLSFTRGNETKFTLISGKNQWRESFTCDRWWTSKAGSNTSFLMSPQPEEEVLRYQCGNTAWQEWILHVSK